MPVPSRTHHILPALAAGFVLLTTLAWSQAAPATAPPVAATPAPAAPAAAAPTAAAPTPAAPPPACKTPEYRQFDFWVGEWDVFGPKGKQVGRSSIRLILGGCVVLENWKGSGGVEGTSLNIYDSADAHWHQAWVDGSGTRLDLAGGLRGGAMVLSGVSAAPAGAKTTERITWTPLEGGKVRQLWEQSSDGGTTWTVAFDGTYVKHADAGAAGTSGATGGADTPGH